MTSARVCQDTNPPVAGLPASPEQAESARTSEDRNTASDRDTIDFMARLRSAGVRLSAEGDKVRFAAPTGVLTPDLRNEIARRKPEILRLLQVDTSNGRATDRVIPPLPRTGTLPLSHEEQRIWFLHHALSDRSTYNVPTATRIRGPLDLARLEGALAAVMQRHEILRTSYIDSNGAPQRVIADTGKLVLDVEEVRPEAGETIEALVSRRLLAAARLPFSLASPPLFRVTCLRLDAQDHILVLVAHHIVCDAWSWQLLGSEVETIYRAASHAAVPALPPLPVQYADYAAWQCQQVASGRMDRQREYWRRQLQDAPPTLDLPADRRRPDEAGHRGECHRFVLERSLADALERFGVRHQATPFMVWLATYAALLHRLSGQTDLVIGTPLAGRTQPDVQHLVGLFLNTLPVRVRFHHTTTFAELLEQTRNVVLEGFEHGDFPLDQILAAPGGAPVTRAGGTSLFPAMFVLHEHDHHDWRFPDTTTEPVHATTETAKADVTLILRRSDDRSVQAAFDYRSDLFTADAVNRIADQWTCLIDAVVHSSDAPIGKLSLLPDEQRHQLVTGFNPVPTPFPRDATVQGLFEQIAEATPAATALILGSREISYGNLDQQSNQLAHRLRELGVTAGTRVAMLLDRSIELVVSILATLKAGAVYVPLDASFPEERLRFIIEDTAARVLITHGGRPEDFVSTKTAVLDLGQEAGPLAHCPATTPGVSRAATDPAYIMYTSGSTGQPKGVVIPHRGIVRLVRGQSYVPFTSSQRFLLLASPAFDASTFELWGALLNGAPCVIFPERWPDFEQLEAEIRTHKITCLWLTAGLFNQIIDQRPGVLTNVRHVLTGGEALSVAHVRRALEHLPHLELINGYGPTESTTFACTYAVPHDGRWPATSVPIGRPISHTRAYILNPFGRPVPIGVSGELFLGGDGLATGYWNRADITAEKFVPDSFADEPDARLYRTGDRCRWLADGTIEFLGRLDDQVKLRGFRIELGEIESVLLQDPAVAQAAVAVTGNSGTHQELVAYVVPRGGAALSAEAMRQRLGQRLPDHMVPARYRVAEALPLNANGKVDRRALLAGTHRELQGESAQSEPRTTTESRLTPIWQRILQREHVGIHDNFFALGGTSLLAMRLVHEIAQEMAQPLRLAAFFGAPTIARLAQCIDHRENHGHHRELPVLRGSGRGTPMFYVPNAGGFEALAPAVARSLDGDRCVCDSLQYPGVDGRSPPLDRVEAIAARLITSIRSVYPNGPLGLSGFCFGGLVAYEIARQLEAAGQSVTALVMWDSLPRVPRRRRTIAETLRLIHNRMTRLTPEKRGRFLKHQLKVAYKALKFTTRQASAEEQIPPPALNKELSEAERDVIKASYRAIGRYRPQPYSGPVLLLRTERNDPEEYVNLVYERPRLDGWDGLLRGPVTVADFACPHLDLLQEPIVSQAAATMADYLRNADRMAHPSRIAPTGDSQAHLEIQHAAGR